MVFKKQNSFWNMSDQDIEECEQDEFDGIPLDEVQEAIDKYKIWANTWDNENKSYKEW